MQTLKIKRNLPLAIVVEDEKALANALSITLSRLGYLVETIQDGREALEQLKFVAPDLLLLDLNLPHVSGDEILDSINGLPEYKDTRILIASADRQLASQYAYMVDQVIEKPFRFQQMQDIATRYHPARSASDITELHYAIS